MAGYICVTYPMTYREEAERLCRVLGRYGFRYRTVTEELGQTPREELLARASALLAVTGITPVDAGFAAMAADIERGLARRIPVLCLSVQDNELDARLTGDGAWQATLIPFTVGRMPDRHSVALFLHRLFIRHLAALSDCFNPDRCVDDGYGRMVALAVRAHRGEGEACYALGRAYESGDRVPAIEHEAALWITRAADSGVPDARIHMGELHLLGRCRHPDPAEAYRLFSLSAKSGDVRGYYHRGLCALHGLGCPRDREAAMADLTVSASAGYAPALYRLGLLYRDAIGTRLDAFEAAIHCFFAACRQGVDTAPAPAASATMWTPAGTTVRWTPTARLGARPFAWTPLASATDGRSVPPRGKKPAGRAPGVDRLAPETPTLGVLTPERAMTVGGRPLPPPPALYSRRAGRKPRAVSLRRLRRTRLCYPADDRSASPAATYPGVSVPGYAPPELRAREALAARCFRRARFRPADGQYPFPKAGWVRDLFGTRTDESALIPPPTERPVKRADPLADLHGTYIERAAFDVADAALALGLLLARGDMTTGVAPHPTRAAVWYRYAALGGSAEAFRRLGDLYRRGAGLPIDRPRAAALYAHSADRGDAEGSFARAVVCERGIGAARNPQEAYRRYEAAARLGLASAQNNLGGCYEHGIGVVPDLLAAVEWYTRAAASGQPDAHCRLGLCYEHGRGVDADLPRALRHYESAARRGHPYALYRLGLCYERGLIEQAHPTDASAHGDCAPTDVLCVPAGVPVLPPTPPVPEALRPTPHYAEAVYLWAEAARRGLSAASYALALCYGSGHGVPRDTDAYFRCLTKAAEGNHIQALYRLGLAYLEGRGTPPDGAYARRCFTRAATLWEARLAAARRLSDADESDALPTGAMTPEAAAAGALYMRGYCTLYAIGETADETAAAPVPVSAAPTPAPACERRHDGAPCTLSTAHRTVLEGPAGAPAEPLAQTPDAHRLVRAVEDFRRAADLGHVGALTALGDLYTYGLLKPPALPDAAEASAPDDRAAARALELYAEAVRIGMTRVFSSDSSTLTKTAPAGEGWLRDDAFRDSTARTALPRAVALRGGGDIPADDPLQALLTVAERTNDLADTREAEGDAGEAELMRVQVWRSLAGAAELGSADALVAMATCAFFGHGTPENRAAALRFLERAETMSGGRVMASLWRGDFHRAGWCATPDIAAADAAYRRALHTPLVGSEGNAYIIANRRQSRRADDRRARAEALYRLATLRAVSGAEGKARDEAFRFLSEALLSGHTAAEDDLSRMYAREFGLLSAARPGQEPPALTDTPTAPRRPRRHLRDSTPPRTHADWMTDYYTALALAPQAFRYELESQADPATTPLYVTAPVTDAMRVNALNYLGDCYFDGQGLTPDAASAVACYRRVVSMKLTVGRGEPPPQGLAWAQYSLGWCLLKGVGTPRDDREAVRWLTPAARTHAEAAYVLADCYERGVDVDVSDDREAIKYYRKALKLGCARAEEKVDELEARIRHTAKD